MLSISQVYFRIFSFTPVLIVVEVVSFNQGIAVREGDTHVWALAWSIQEWLAFVHMRRVWTASVSETIPITAIAIAIAIATAPGGTSRIRLGYRVPLEFATC